MININNLSYYYDAQKKIPVLSDLTFDVGSGEFVAVMGPNGSGKTTLAMCLGGFLKTDEGMITYDSKNKLTSPPGILLQNPDDQLLNPTVYRELAFGLELRGVSPERIVERVNKYVKIYNLESLLNKNPQLLSGGEKQKIALLSILLCEPELMILDEPSSYLDQNEAGELTELISTSVRKKKRTLIYITFNPYEALKAHRFPILNK